MPRSTNHLSLTFDSASNKNRLVCELCDATITVEHSDMAQWHDPDCPKAGAEVAADA